MSTDTFKSLITVSTVSAKVADLKTQVTVGLIGRIKEREGGVIPIPLPWNGQMGLLVTVESSDYTIGNVTYRL